MKTRKTLSDGSLKQAVQWLFHDEMFAGYKRHGNASWSFSALVTMALIWAWGADDGLQQRFRSGLKVLPRLFRRTQWGMTYQGFIKLLSTWSASLLSAVVGRLREQMQQVSGVHWTVHGWVVMAVDGTRVETPRTKENEAHFDRIPQHHKRPKKSSRRRKRKQHPPAPQVWLTVMWQVGVGLLWDWRQGPSRSSERAHLLEMLDRLPDSTLLVADAGFQGYEYWQALLERGHSFLIRAGGNVRLLRGLGHVRRRRGIVYLWPEKVRRRKQAPIVLRLFELHEGRRSMWLLSNVLDPQKLSQRQALEIYRLRWGVEVFIRGFKQTFGRGKLRSHAPQNVELELDWSLVALWSLELLAIGERLARGGIPHDVSLVSALRAIRGALQSAALGLDSDLFSQLAASRHDGYRRRRKSIRKWPKKKVEPPVSMPKIQIATREQINDANELRSHAA